ncbi:MAG: phosphate acetyltransferase [Candidatus Omnitrophica bacterium]|nr:phosphate acetyltransferase [Candidatus Omnitrophota bacterium]
MQIERFLRDKAKGIRSEIILPEAGESRVQKAVRIINKEKIARVLLLEKKKLSKNKIKKFANTFYELRRQKGISMLDAVKIVSDPLYYAAMMVKNGEADGFVAGAHYTTPNVARAAIYCLGVDKRFSIASSSFIVAIPDCKYGEAGIFIFADCGIVPDPSSDTLANIAICTAQIARDVIGIKPRVAMLSYSTRGSSVGRLVQKVRRATELVKEKAPGLLVDGEMQVDSAIVPEVSRIKYPNSKLKGRANVLIFPNLEAGNIGYKLVQRLANARAIGPILQGLNFPCSDLSRGCSVDDIVDCVAVTAIRSKKKSDGKR